MRFSRAFCITRLLVLAAGLLFTAVGLCTESVSVVDSAGLPLGTVPVLQRGSETLVPLGTLSRLANWSEHHSDSACAVWLGDKGVAFQLGNPFARIGSGFVQLRVSPELWDGSFWVPATNLANLFGRSAGLSADGGTIHLLAAAPTGAGSAGEHGARSTWKLGTIIVDPGHGGKDPGAPGPPGWHEKTITLDIALRLVTLIEKKGLHATLTRSGDEFVSLRNRTRIANETHGDLFLSIHCNSNQDKNIHGVQAYFLKPARTAQAVETAVRENSVVSLEESGDDYRDLTQENYILLSMATSQNMKDSETWAAQATAKTAALCKLTPRGVDQAGFYVLMGAQMPAVLVECGYMSNATDVKVLTSEKGRQAIAEALLNSILDMKTKLETAASR